jgi:hypothetical protein
MTKSLGIYVPSYRRSDKIMTQDVLNECTYVVRKSEEAAYRSAGVLKIWAIEDELINSFPKVRQYIIDNAPEDIIVQIDDDMQKFSYANQMNIEWITDKDIIDAELERVAQILEDLQLGFASLNMTIDVRKYNKEYAFKGLIGGVCWYNKEFLKGKYDEKVKLKADIDFELQELLKNRIIIIPEYLRKLHKYDTNAGGNTDVKNSVSVRGNVDYLRIKWGYHFSFNYESNVAKVNVER